MPTARRLKMRRLKLKNPAGKSAGSKTKVLGVGLEPTRAILLTGF